MRNTYLPADKIKFPTNNIINILGNSLSAQLQTLSVAPPQRKIGTLNSADREIHVLSQFWCDLLSVSSAQCERSLFLCSVLSLLHTSPGAFHQIIKEKNILGCLFFLTISFILCFRLRIFLKTNTFQIIN